PFPSTGPGMISLAMAEEVVDEAQFVRPAAAQFDGLSWVAAHLIPLEPHFLAIAVETQAPAVRAGIDGGGIPALRGFELVPVIVKHSRAGLVALQLSPSIVQGAGGHASDGCRNRIPVLPQLRRRSAMLGSLQSNGAGEIEMGHKPIS